MSTPLYDSLLNYIEEVGLRLHMPGHAGGLGMNSSFLRAVAALDVTELAGIDDLHAPQGALAASQRMAARLYGAESSHYLVNGASVGVHALIVALCREGDQVLIPRNAHRCFWGALMISGAVPAYLPVQCDPHTGEAVSVAPRDIETAVLAAGKHCRGLFLTSPSYLGTVLDLPAAAAVAAQRGLPLCVDEAHGGHFAFSPTYPASALQCGAAAAVNGLHKNLAVLNQGAIMHLGAAFPEPDRAIQALRLLTTTSPSFPILASIELALESMHREGAALLESARDFHAHFSETVNALPGLHCLDEEFLAVPGVCANDPLKLVISCRQSGLTGYELDARLRREKGIQVEMAGLNYILAMFSPGHKSEQWDYFAQALADLARRYPRSARPTPLIEPPPTPVACLSPRQAFNSRWEKVPLHQAAGRIAAEMVAAYPPGVPCLAPGELVTPDLLEYLFYLKGSAVRIQGPRDPELETLLVIMG